MTTPPQPPAVTDWQPAPPLPSPRPRRTRLILAISAAAVLLVAVIATVRLIGGSHDFTVHGGVAVNGTDSFTAVGGDNNCAGSDGYDDLKAGAEVVVSDSSGKTIAVGSVTDSAAHGAVCLLTFEVAKVPSGKNFYGIEVTHRGVVKYSEKEMKAGPVLTIGDTG